MAVRLKIEVILLIGAFFLWYSLAPEDQTYSKCLFNAEHPQILAACQNAHSQVDGLKAQGHAAVALNITRDMLDIFEAQLGNYHEKSSFGAMCSDQTHFYWLQLESVKPTDTASSQSVRQIYTSFPDSTMDGADLENRIPLVKTEAAANKSISVSADSQTLEGSEIYIPRLVDCKNFRIHFYVEYDDQGSDLSQEPASTYTVALGEGNAQKIELEVDGMNLVFNLKSSEVPANLAQQQKLHSTYSFDNQLLLIGDIFHRSIAMRFEQINFPVLHTAFIIDFHDRVLPYFTKGSPQQWRETTAAFNFVIDSGIMQGVLPTGLQMYYIN